MNAELYLLISVCASCWWANHHR